MKIRKSENWKGRVSSLIEGLNFPEATCGSHVLLIVPPFQALKYPSLGVHLLQACGREAGLRVQVLYANMVLATLIGEEVYAKILDLPDKSFARERFFARSAFGLPPLGRRANRMFQPNWVIGPKKNWEIRPDFDSCSSGKPLTLTELRRLERCAVDYVEDVAKAVGEPRFRIVGCTTTFEQTTASLALLNRIKTLSKDTITILGGANCEAEMACGIASLPSSIDYIFSGESELTFVKFVRDILAGLRPKDRLIRGRLCTDMDALPQPAFEEFFEQRKRYLPSSKLHVARTEIPYETSRGCWWGQKHHCVFCGFNDEAIAFRQKSPDRVIKDLNALLNTCPTKKVGMTDCIMPHTYFRTLLPRLAGERLGATIFYEQKANLSLPDILALKRAGITTIQPGIESLSSRLLTLMNKGVGAPQNLMLLRYARAAGVNLYWNLLWGFPGDDVEAYEETLAILPLLHHLQPPHRIVHLSIDRFSPYFSRRPEFGVRNIKPLAGYYDFLPKGADVERIAYQFTAEYRCGAHDHVEVIARLCQAVARWRAVWKQQESPPNQDLKIIRNRECFHIVDTRDIWKKKREYSLNEKETCALASPKPYSGSGLESWAVREKIAAVVDGWFVPLAVAEPEVFLGILEIKRESNEHPTGFYMPCADSTFSAERRKL